MSKLLKVATEPSQNKLQFSITEFVVFPILHAINHLHISALVASSLWNPFPFLHTHFTLSIPAHVLKMQFRHNALQEVAQVTSGGLVKTDSWVSSLSILIQYVCGEAQIFAFLRTL